MRSRFFFFCCVFLALPGFCGAEDFEISQRTFDEAGSHTVFTFRNGRLIYELTQFEATSLMKKGQWVERFYAKGRMAGLRTGMGAQWSSIHFTSNGDMIRAGARLTVGGETYDLGKDGFYHVIADPNFMLRQSVIEDPIFSTRALDAQRENMIASPEKAAK